MSKDVEKFMTKMYDFRYKPIGFSITSMESCSPNVLKDAIEATETAMTTLLTVIGK